MQVFIRNHGDPVSDRRVAEFGIEGWPHAVAVGDRIEISDDILGYMARPLGSESAIVFGLFLAGLWNKRSYPRPWITLEDGDGNAIDDEGNVVTATQGPAQGPAQAPAKGKGKKS